MLKNAYRSAAFYYPAWRDIFWKNLKKFVIKEGLFEVDVVSISLKGLDC